MPPINKDRLDKQLHWSSLSPPPRVGIYLGIDPGASGGLAMIVPPTGVKTQKIQSGSVKRTKMPPTERDIWDWIYDHSPLCNPNEVYAVIERVGGYIGEAQPGSAAFKFGQSYGGLRMALIAAGIPFEAITPQEWQRVLGLGCRKKGESKTSWKNKLKAKAQELFPREKVTLATADALLLAEVCRRRHQVQVCDGIPSEG